MTINRRKFLCGCSAGIAAMAGSRFGTLAFGAPGFNTDTLVVVFLRGGMDGMNLVPPKSHSDRSFYQSYRGDIGIPEGSVLSLSNGGGFGLHPSAPAMRDVWNEGKLAILHAVGMTTVTTRSHFDAMEFMELGTPGVKATGTGWLTRHLATADNLPSEIVMPSLSVGSSQTTSLLGDLNTFNMQSPSDFDIDTGPWRWTAQNKIALQNMYRNGTSLFHESGQRALDAIDVIQSYVSGSYTPAGGAATYYNNAGGFGDQMEVIAQMIRNPELGLRVATIDLGGWDTHNSQESGGNFPGRVDDLSNGLAGLYLDLKHGGGLNRTTVVVMSEFGRRMRENADRGTDHGYGNRCIVMGGKVNGGRFHGAWPGLALGQLFDQADLAVTVDIRRVLSEILVRRMANPKIEAIFPGYGQQYVNDGPVGIVQGTDLPIDTSPGGGADILLSDNFELGNLSRWSSTVP